MPFKCLRNTFRMSSDFVFWTDYKAVPVIQVQLDATGGCFQLFGLQMPAFSRMLYVARRPLPRATAGLGIWKSIILYTTVAAVACNVGLASIFFYPMRLRPPGQQLTMFIIGEHVLFLLQAGVSAFVPEEPSDVIDIKYFNRHVLGILGRRRHHEQLVPPVHSNLNTIDLSLNPENWDSDSSVSSLVTSGSSRPV